MEVSELIFLGCMEKTYNEDAMCHRDCGCDDDGGCVER